MNGPLTEKYDELVREGSGDPLGGTLAFADRVTGGALRKAPPSILGRPPDPGDVAEKRAAGMPLEYILGFTVFLGELLHCREGALVPRAETELLAGTCIGFLERLREAGIASPKVIELGTGAGNIAVLLALRARGAEIYASDISGEAIAVASANVERCGVAGAVTLLRGDMFEPLEARGLEGMTDLVVCNPPYIPTTSVDRLDPLIRDHEPRVALDAGAFGIDIFKRLIRGAPGFLRPGGLLAFEIGAGQEKLVERLFRKVRESYGEIREVDDGKDVRVVTALRA